MFGSSGYGSEHLNTSNVQGNLEQPTTNTAYAPRLPPISSPEGLQSNSSHSTANSLQGGNGLTWYNVQDMTNSASFSQSTWQMPTTQPQHSVLDIYEEHRVQHQQHIAPQVMPWQQQQYYQDTPAVPDLYEGNPNMPAYQPSLQPSSSQTRTDVHSQEHLLSNSPSYESAYFDIIAAAQPITSGAMTTPSIIVTPSDALRYPPTTASAQQIYNGARFLTQNYSLPPLDSQHQLQEASSANTGQDWAWKAPELPIDSSMDMQRQSQESVAPVSSRTLGRQTRPAATRRASKRRSIIHNGVSIEVVPATRPRSSATAAASGRPTSVRGILQPFDLPEERPAAVSAKGRQEASRRRTFDDFQNGYTAEAGPVARRTKPATALALCQVISSPDSAEVEEPMTPPRKATPRPPVTIHEDVSQYLEAATQEMLQSDIEESVETRDQINARDNQFTANPHQATAVLSTSRIPRTMTAAELAILTDDELSHYYTW